MDKLEKLLKLDTFVVLTWFSHRELNN